MYVNLKTQNWNYYSNIDDIEKIRENIKSEYNMWKEVEKEFIEKNEQPSLDFSQRLIFLQDDVKVLDKLERKLKMYMTIKIEKNRDYETLTTRIIFPKRTPMKKKIKFLELNGYPTKSYHIPIYSDYDCTGQVHYVCVEYIANAIEITKYLDV